MIDKDAVVNRHQLYNKNNFLAMKKCKTRQTAVVVLRKLVICKKKKKIARCARMEAEASEVICKADLLI